MSTEFKRGDPVVYPTHGVGEVTGIVTLELGGVKTKFYTIRFSKDNMILKIPVAKSAKAGLRPTGTMENVEQAIRIIRGRARAGRGMWSRRAAEYLSKINSGQLSLAAQVVRDLHKNVDDPDRSYSERVIYESALERLSREFAVVQTITTEQSTLQIEAILKAKRAAPANEESDAVNDNLADDLHDDEDNFRDAV